ncbi:hypothetical protein QTJ16_004620 [Diplocarpon rosae]|uniref:Peptide hydrolase n=1 Tax=Diplocarpon rosae TaxID=946125 RepID=A0AAD9WDP6_9HELO|nr:hypothetical protein QTJ16_004620 [Diplocarpon rosae]
MRFSSTLSAFVASLSLVAGWPDQIRSYPGTQRGEDIDILTPQVSTTKPQEWVDSLTRFHNRDYRSSYGSEAGDWLLQKIKDVTKPNLSIKTKVFKHTYNQPSFIVRIPAKPRDGKISERIVVASTYYDSTAGNKDARAPGAVDNASTVAALLEALRVLSQAKYEAQNNIEFHFYGGSKGGRLGSKDVMAKYIEEKKDIIAFLHQAKIGYSRTDEINVYNDFSDPALVKYITEIAAKYAGKVFSYGYCGMRCNDHVSAHEKGYPAAYVTGELFSRGYFDTPGDTFAEVDFDAVKRHARFTIAYLAEAGNF